MPKAVATQFHPEDGDDRALIEVLHPDNGEKTSRQIADLLALRNEARGMLITREEIGTVTNIDPEAAKDAREIYTLTGHQIRNIVDDMQRWQLDLGKAERRTLDLLEVKQKIVQEAQAFNTRPSVNYRPRIAQMPILPDNKLVWIVWLGADEPQANGPHGIGQSPDEAMLNFDKNWTTRIPIKIEGPPTMNKTISPDEGVPGDTSTQEKKE